jgi:hypothetical protein
MVIIGRNCDTLSIIVPKAGMFNLVRDSDRFGKILSACGNIHLDARNAE